MTGANFYYLPGAKEVIIGRPVLEPAGLLPEQQLENLKGSSVEAKVAATRGEKEEHRPIFLLLLVL